MEIGSEFPHNQGKNRIEVNINTLYPDWLDSQKNTDTTVVTFGFGAGKELKTLRGLFPNAKIYAFDKDSFAIDTAILTNNKYELDIKISKRDSRDEGVYKDNALSPDIVVIRSFGVVNDDAVARMKSTLEAAYKHLNSGGLIYLSTELAAEFENMKRMLDELELSYKHLRDTKPKPPGTFRENDVFIVHK